MARRSKRNPSPRALAELSRRAPEIAAEDFAAAIETFEDWRRQKESCDSDDIPVFDLANLTAQLHGLLSTMNVSARYFIDFECSRRGDKDLVDRMCDNLARLNHLANDIIEDDQGKPRRGRDLAFRTRFIWMLAYSMEQNGFVPDASPTGPLVLAAKIGFEELGELVKDVEGTVKQYFAVRKRRKQRVQ